MTDTPERVESADEFADRQWSWLSREKLREAVRARDAAIRRQAIEMCVAALKKLWYREHNAGPNERLGDGSPYVIDECIATIRALAKSGDADG